MYKRREITQPIGKQGPQVIRWKDSLRSEGDGAYLTDVPRTSSSLKRSNSAGNLRKSTGSLAANFTMNSTKGTKTSAELATIEAEYIKNLQQQVYFLELEANFLREQARKATDMHPQMTAEAERMLTKLRQMQAEMDGLHLEVKRKEASLDIISTDKERALGKLKAEEEAHRREKSLLMEEIVQLKKEKDLIERDTARKDMAILQAQEDREKAIQAMKGTESKNEILKNQLEQKVDQHKLVQTALEEKRTEQLKVETRLREVEEKYYSSSVTIQDKVVQDLRDEIRMLRQKLKETEMNADQDRYLRNKMSDDSSHLVKENALLNQQVLELQKVVERERDLRENQDTRRNFNITELLETKEREKKLQFELQQAKDLLKHEQDRLKHYMEQLTKQEQITTSTELNANTTQSKLMEVSGINQSLEAENSQLRRDKMLLVDHVADLQKQLEDKNHEMISAKAQQHTVERRLKELEHLKDLETSVHSQKWEEFSRLAESMKHLSQTMLSRTHSPSPTPRSKVLEY